MKRIIIAIVIISAFLGNIQKADSQTVIPDKQAIIDSLTTLDRNITKYFPRWRVCEPDLMIQIYQTFLYQYDESLLDQQNIEVLAAPKSNPDMPFDILMISCGDTSMNAVQIDAKMSNLLIGYLSGELVYQGYDKGYPPQSGISKRDYCYDQIPAEVPVRADQTEAIISYLQPHNVTHAFTISLFEQSIKIGGSGFWLRNKVGTDEIGYPFWSAGEAKAMLQRPLYINNDPDTRRSIRYLINAYLGGGYRVTSGLPNGNNPILSWVEDRRLNVGPGGKFIAGFDFHLPTMPEFGLGVNFELPLESLGRTNVDEDTYATYSAGENVDFAPGNPDAANALGRIDRIAPILRASGQIKLFYHLWINKKTNPENYFRFEFGLNYNEVQEAALYEINEEDETAPIDYIATQGIQGLRLFKPNEFGDWMFAKVEYRNQDVFPFGASIQYSNQMLLSTVYIPLFGNWLYLEGKYATPLRGVRPYEMENFYMISPVIRLTI